MMSSSVHVTPSSTPLTTTVDSFGAAREKGASTIKDPWYSAIYEGTVRHRRYTPKHHEFTYRVFMVYVDLQEIDSVFSQTPWWSSKKLSLAWFRRKDFFDGQASVNLYDAVANYVEKETSRRPVGAIRMLTNLRYFGFLINPITCYYCFDQEGQQLETVVAEVTNTPWGQRRHYIIDLQHTHRESESDTHALSKQKRVMPSPAVLFEKTMHVSPFQPMDLVYGWRGKAPTQQLAIHLDVFKNEIDADGSRPKVKKSKIALASDASSPVFDATLLLKRCPMTKNEMNKKIFRYPLMTIKVFAAIYWQAMKLWVKKIPFYGAPEYKSTKYSADVYDEQKR
ncbi:DUF1365 domain-containing protein [Eionea flava]